MNPRFEKFYETNLYIFYGQPVYEEITDVEKLGEYEILLHDFRVAFKIDYEIDNDAQVIEYIDTHEEYIDEDNQADFIVFSKIILEKLFEIISGLKGHKKKVVVESTKQQLKNMDQLTKQLARDEREQAKQEKAKEKFALKSAKDEEKRLQMKADYEEKMRDKEAKQLLKQQQELEKNKEKENIKLQKLLIKEEQERKAAEAVARNLEIYECECGMSIQRMQQINHQKGRDHIIRLEAICSFIKRKGLNIDI